ncbi:hypothetical protein ACOME3_003479 [Neoechinorhynchus agilis]
MRNYGHTAYRFGQGNTGLRSMPMTIRSWVPDPQMPPEETGLISEFPLPFSGISSFLVMSHRRSWIRTLSPKLALGAQSAKTPRRKADIRRSLHIPKLYRSGFSRLEVQKPVWVIEFESTIADDY